jgi:hypothetical protein
MNENTLTQQANYHVRSSSTKRQRSGFREVTWDGATVVELNGKVAELFPQVPVFSRHPFRVGTEENRLRDEIHREPLNLSDEPYPVTTVTKAYSLIQHRDVLKSVFKALKMLDIDISGLDSTLLLSEHGERMQWNCNIPHIDFDPGDGCPIVLQINCLNSVDTSTALEITFAWFRLVCSNGMMFGLRDSRLRRRHIQSLDPEDIAKYLKKQLEEKSDEEGLHKKWFHSAVEVQDLVPWINGIVAKEWGPHLAARVWHILTDGCDVDIEQARNVKPHELPWTSARRVPGAFAPVSNLFHVSQALSWIAGTRNTIPEQLEYVKAIPRLLEPLEPLTDAP